ncbi:P1 family peptidase [Mycolicibacterium goodii]|nr:P1 family peptidase [Mycolicibacterium goodii]
MPGVSVGHAFADSDPSMCTGVTVVVPHPGDLYEDRLFAGVSVFNGTGEMTGRSVIEEWGLLAGPITLSSTRHVGVAYDAVSAWMERRHSQVGVEDIVIPVVAECDDSYLAGPGRLLKPDDVWTAIDGATGGAVSEGCVGAGAGMQFFGYKGGIGTSSRVVPTAVGAYTVGVLLNTNYGVPEQLLISGRPAAAAVPDPPPRSIEGSCIAIVGTDAPLLPNQLRRLARRVDAGLARTGSVANDGSGEMSIAFSSATKIGRRQFGEQSARYSPQGQPWRDGSIMSNLFQAVVEATEEAALNAACAATTTIGRTGNKLEKLPHDVIVGPLE